MSQLSTFYSPLTAADLGLGNSANVTFGSVTTGAVTGSGNATFGSIQDTPIGNTTPNSGAFTTLTANNGTLTASAPVLDLSQTWNDSGTTFIGALINCTATANSNTSSYFEIQRSGTTQFSVVASNASIPYLEIGAGGFRVRVRGRTASGVGLNFEGTVGIRDRLELGTASSSTTAGDTHITRDAADTLALQRSTNPQTFNIYNTFTNTTNYERGFLRWSSNTLQIGTEKAGTGSARALEFQTDGVTHMTIADNGNISIARLTAFSQNVSIAGGRVLSVNQINLNATANAVLALGNDSVIRWSSTSAFPSLRRSGTTLRVRLADDSDFTAIQGKLTTETAYTAGAPTATGYLVLYDSNGTAYKVPAEAL